MIPLNFLGDCSHYIELPKPDEIYNYEKYLNANYLLENISSVVEQKLDDITNLDNSNNNNFKFVL